MIEINWDCDCCWKTVNPDKDPHKLHDVFKNKTYLQAYHLECYKKFQDILRNTTNNGIWNGVDPN